jgi:hypothetical protein
MCGEGGCRCERIAETTKCIFESLPEGHHAGLASRKAGGGGGGGRCRLRDACNISRENQENGMHLDQGAKKNVRVPLLFCCLEFSVQC